MGSKHGKGTLVLLGEKNISGQSNAAELSTDVDVAEDTSFTATAKTYVEGQRGDQVSLNGFFTDDGTTALEKYLDDLIGGASDNLLTVIPGVPSGAADGDIGYSGLVEHAQRNLAIPVAGVVTLRALFQLLGSLARVTIVKAGTVSATGTGTAYNLGAVAAGEMVVSIIICTTVTGAGNFTFTLESDTAEGFPSTATQVSHAATSAVGFERLTTNGAITDTWWRSSWTKNSGTSVAVYHLVGIVKQQG